MRGRLVIGSIGMAAILLAALGLAVDISRGVPVEITMGEIVYDVDATVDFERVSPSAPLAGPCLSDCDARTTLNIVLQGLPAGSYQGTFGDEEFQFRQSASGYEGGFDVPRVVDGQQVSVAWQIGGGSVPRLNVDVNQEVSEHAVVLVAGSTVVEVEQIGAVEVSALIQASTTLMPPPGTVMSLWLDDRGVGTLEGGKLDARVERLSLEDVEQITIRLVDSADPSRIWVLARATA